MSKREIFNKVKEHLLTQNAKSTSSSAGGCAYRGDSGLKCAVGCLIKDEFYTLEMEDRTADDRMVSTALELSGIQISRDLEDMLCTLQQIHDKCPVEDWKMHLDKLDTKLFVGNC